MKNVYVYSYNQGSQGAAELAKELSVYRILHEGSRFRGKPFKTVINWGSSQVPQEVAKCRVLNKPQHVRTVANKLDFFRLMTDALSSEAAGRAKGAFDPPRTVPWTTSKAEAQKWLEDGKVIVCRKVLTGHSGKGIVITLPNDIPLEDAPLYTEYRAKSHEFRIHFIGGQVIAEQRKIRDPDRQPTDWKVRSHDNGFIFVRTGFIVPKDVLEQSTKAFVASRLDSGGVDCIWSEKQQKAYILEINSACGLEGQTVKDYGNGFRKLLTKGT